MAASAPRELQEILAGARPPAGFTREDRVRLIGEAAEALLAGRMPEPAARVFLAGALVAWLENSGDLARDFLRVTKPKSHRTPAAIWRAHRDERHAEAGRARIAASSTAKGITECPPSP
jgi:hypothetical protein